MLLASIAFYLFSGPKYIVYIAVTSITTYLLARKIQSLHDKETNYVTEHELSKDKKKEIKKKYTRVRKFWLILDLLINLGMLCVIKYAD